MEENLIDRDVAENYFGCSDWEILAKETLREVPLVDAVPVRHGNWINIPPYQCEAGYKKGQQCSECYAYYVSDGTAPWSNHKYCAECGAKMDGEIEWEGEQA